MKHRDCVPSTLPGDLLSLRQNNCGPRLQVNYNQQATACSAVRFAADMTTAKESSRRKFVWTISRSTNKSTTRDTKFITAESPYPQLQTDAKLEKQA
jgi:hypothetical protein